MISKCFKKRQKVKVFTCTNTKVEIKVYKLPENKPLHAY